MRFRRLVAVGTVVALLTRARAAARDVPVSPVTADWYVGPTFPERAGLATDDRPVGELDDLAELDGADFDADALAPDVRRFYERTSEYRMTYRATWHRPFRTGAGLATHLTGRIENLDLPGPGDDSWHGLESRFVGVDEPAGDRPGREHPRAWVRTDPETGEAVFVALYATQSGPTGRLVNIAAPLPASNVSTVLRPALLDGGDDEIDGGDDADGGVDTGEGDDADDNGAGPGIRLTTRGAGDPGLYLRTPAGVLGTPMDQEFRVWATPEAEWDLAAVHEMWLFDRRFLTVDYRIRREGVADGETGDDDRNDDSDSDGDGSGQ